MLVLRALCGRSSQPKARVDFAKLTDFLYKSHFGTRKNCMSGSLRRRNCVKLYFVTLPASGILKLFFECSSVMDKRKVDRECAGIICYECPLVPGFHWLLGYCILISVSLLEDLPFFLPL